MNVYVAGRWTKKDEVRAVQSEVRALGHRITFDWTECEDPAPGMADADVVRYLGEQARRDIGGVVTADAVIVLHDSTGRGLFAEMGCALADPSKIVIVVGPPLEPGACVFYFHPRVRYVHDVTSALYALGRSHAS